jgi:hypothetical protein
VDPGSLSPDGRGSDAGALSGADDPVTAEIGAETMRFIPLIALLTARLTPPDLFLATFFLAAFFLGGAALRAFTARFERAIFLAGLFAALFERLGAFFAFFAVFFLATRLAI